MSRPRSQAGGRVLVGHIDGGARGNPGPAGYGVHLEERVEGEDAVRQTAELFGYLGTTTNNIAEYAALLALLEYAVPLKPAALEIFSDSELLVRQMEGRYRVKDARLRVLHAAARRLAGTIENITLRHVRREENRAADALANHAMDSRESSGPLPAALRALPPPPSQARLL
jgi:ribonuclease HI